MGSNENSNVDRNSVHCNTFDHRALSANGDLVSKFIGGLMATKKKKKQDITGLRKAVKNFETEYIKNTLQMYGGNVSRSAEALQCDRGWLHRRMKALKINVKGARQCSHQLTFHNA